MKESELAKATGKDRGQHFKFPCGLGTKMQWKGSLKQNKKPSTSFLQVFLFSLHTVKVVTGKKGMATILLIFQQSGNLTLLSSDFMGTLKENQTQVATCRIKPWDSITKRRQVVRAQQLQRSLPLTFSPNKEPLYSMNPGGTRIRSSNCWLGKSIGGLYFIFWV